MGEAYIKKLEKLKELYADDPLVLQKLMYPQLTYPRVKTSKAYVLGQERDWRFELDDDVSDLNKVNETEKPMEVTAVGTYCYVWQEIDPITRNPLPLNGTITAADIINEFDTTIYETNHNHFGSEPNPGIDGDTKVHILFLSLDGDGESSGYFFGYNQYAKTADPGGYYQRSNEAECIIIDSDESAKTWVYQTVAHEFQHMIHWQGDDEHNESTWVNEGCSIMAEYFCYGSAPDYSQEGIIEAFQNEPAHSLTEWTQVLHDYGQAYAFFFYLW